MSRHHNRPRPTPAPPGAVPGELHGRAGPWLAGRAADRDADLAGISASETYMTSPPGYQPGGQQDVAVPAPRAGHDWSYTVDGRWSEQVLAAAWTLTTSAVVANRVTILQLVNAAGRVMAAVPAAPAVPAGTTAPVRLMTGAPALAASAAGLQAGWLPGWLVPPGWSWQTVTTALDAGDTMTLITLLVQRFPSDITRRDRGASREERT